MKELFDGIKQLLEKKQRISIIIHRNPDGDAIGSGLALQNALKQAGHDVSLISPNEIPNYLNWLPEVNTIINFEKKPDEVLACLSNSQLIFTLDFNDFSRTGLSMEKELKKLTDKKLL